MDYHQPVILTGERRRVAIDEIERLKAEQRARNHARAFARKAICVLLGAQRRADAAMVAKGYAKKQGGAGRGP